MTRTLTVLLMLAGVQALGAQTLPIIKPEHLQLITQEISGDAAYEHIRVMTHLHRTTGGGDGLWNAAAYHEQKAMEFELEDVQLIKQAYSRGSRPWNARFADLWIVEPVRERIASTLQTPLHLADYSRATDVTTELIDAGTGSDAADYVGKDVSGKIVLANGSLEAVMREAVWNKGAAGVVWYPSTMSDVALSRPDQLRWTRVSPEGPDGQLSTFAFSLSLRQGLALKQRLARSQAPVRVRAVVDAEFTSEAGDEPWQVMVEAYIRGTEPELGQDVVLTGHLQEEKTSANDDASGTASLLEIGRALTKLIDEGSLPRPRRNIRFWWVTEISSQRQYFADHPEAHHQMWVNVNNDMVGANQAQDVMRVQNITRLPASRFHFFNDVAEAVIEYMVAANTSQLAQTRAGVVLGTDLYTKPHLSHLGTRHRYNASMIFFHNSTDHMTFNEAPIGVPGVTFTNWPDRYIHSSDDDLWNVDRTQFGRNIVSTALMAWIMATADESTTPALAAETLGRGAQRIGNNLALALSWLGTETEKTGAYHRGVKQVRYAAARERLAVTSLQELGSEGAAMVPQLLEAVNQRETQAVSEVEQYYRLLTGQRPAPQVERSDAQRRLADLHPTVTADPTEFLPVRQQIPGVPGLHDLMAFEVLNCIDGERTGLEIYEYVAAEAREAGEHYYGTVTPEAVERYLEALAEFDLIGLR
jgi:hypothetical protein